MELIVNNKKYYFDESEYLRLKEDFCGYIKGNVFVSNNNSPVEIHFSETDFNNDKYLTIIFSIDKHTIARKFYKIKDYEEA